MVAFYSLGFHSQNIYGLPFMHQVLFLGTEAKAVNKQIGIPAFVPKGSDR